MKPRDSASVRARHDVGALVMEAGRRRRPTEVLARHRLMAALRAEGLEIRVIGTRLGVSSWTVRAHLNGRCHCETITEDYGSLAARSEYLLVEVKRLRDDIERLRAVSEELAQ